MLCIFVSQQIQDEEDRGGELKVVFSSVFEGCECVQFCFFSWSRNGHKLLSASTDNNVCIWDILSGECEQKYRFPSPILKVK